LSCIHQADRAPPPPARIGRAGLVQAAQRQRQVERDALEHRPRHVEARRGERQAEHGTA
jgi:hypothetical protein